nr:S-adenosylmethionine synthetase [uncultured bacterium]
MRRGKLLRQPDRPLRGGRPGRRCRPDRPQDHRRHLWWRGAPWRRRLLGQGSDQGRPFGRLCRALSGEECRRRQPRRQVHHSALLCDRRFQAAFGLCRHPRDRQYRRAEAGEGAGRSDGSQPARHPHASRPQQADLCAHFRLWPFRPRAGGGWRLLLGTPGSGCRSEGGIQLS